MFQDGRYIEADACPDSPFTILSIPEPSGRTRGRISKIQNFNGSPPTHSAGFWILEIRPRFLPDISSAAETTSRPRDTSVSIPPLSPPAHTNLRPEACVGEVARVGSGTIPSCSSVFLYGMVALAWWEAPASRGQEPLAIAQIVADLPVGPSGCLAGVCQRSLKQVLMRHPVEVVSSRQSPGGVGGLRPAPPRSGFQGV